MEEKAEGSENYWEKVDKYPLNLWSERVVNVEILRKVETKNTNYIHTYT